MSSALDLVTLAAALREVESFSGETGWRARNSEQEAILARLETLSADAARVPELAAWARRTAEELNEILAARGFSIRLNPWPDDGESFGVVAIDDVRVAWLEKGETKDDRGEAFEIRGHRAFRLATNKAGVSFRSVPGTNHPLIRVSTRSGDEVWMIRLEQPAEGLALFEAWERLKQEAVAAPLVWFDGLIAPMIHLDTSPDISWLLGFEVGTTPWGIAQALAQIRLGMNQKGARVVSAVAIGMVLGGFPRPPSDYVLEGPFLFALVRPGLTHPLVVAYLDESCWREPGKLGKI